MAVSYKVAIDEAVKLGELCADDPIVALPRPSNAGAHVLVDGRYYCSFFHHADARESVERWREKWPAARGKAIEVVSGLN